MTALRTASLFGSLLILSVNANAQSALEQLQGMSNTREFDGSRNQQTSDANVNRNNTNVPSVTPSTGTAGGYSVGTSSGSYSNGSSSGTAGGYSNSTSSGTASGSRPVRRGTESTKK